jgi:hypothetical protein
VAPEGAFFLVIEEETLLEGTDNRLGRVKGIERGELDGWMM